MALPEKDTRARWWGLEQWIGENGSGKWNRIQAVPTGRDTDHNRGGRLLHWFPIETYSEAGIRAACGPGTFRVFFQPESCKAKWAPSPAFTVEPDPPTPTLAAAPPEASQTPPAPAPVPAMRPAPGPTPAAGALALVPPGYVPRPPPGYMPPPAEPVFERYHHLAAEDADRVVLAVTNLGAAFQSAVAQMAAATIAVSGQRAAEWQGLATQLLAHATAPKVADPTLLQLAQGQQAMASSLQALVAKVESLEEEDDDEPPPPPPGESIGQQMLREVVPAVVNLAPKALAYFENRNNPKPPAPADGSPNA